jgi:peptidoglycan-associated lipoprotein
MNMKSHLLIGLACALLAVGGCASKRPPSPANGTGADAGAGTSIPSGATTGGVGSDSSRFVDAGGEGIAGPQAGLLGKRIVYFDFDRAEIRADQGALVAAHAGYLAAHASAHVRLEGHTDERGTREYNLGLGERRAQAVRRALMLQGVAEGQIATVSYGAERPAVAGSDEAAWSQNRRVEIVYLSQ